MSKKRNLLQKYKWTIGTTLVWMLLVSIGFYAEREEIKPEYFLVAVLAFIMYQTIFGIRLDKKAQKEYIARENKQKKELAELGETAWMEQQRQKAAENKILKRENWQAFFTDLFCSALYLFLARLVFGGGHKWIVREIRGLLWFFITFYITAYLR